jgi:hypothetical protein
MKDEEFFIDEGPFAGYKGRMASTGSIEALQEIADDFMWRIFEWAPGEYFISDDSMLSDFELDKVELASLRQKVSDIYNLDFARLQSDYLVDIFSVINEAKERHDSPR